MDGNNHVLPPEARHEHADVNIWAVSRFGLALALLCVVSLGLLFGLFRYVENYKIYRSGTGPFFG